MTDITQIFIKSFIETILVSGLIGYFIMQREERMKKTIEEEFKKRDKFFDAGFNFKLRALEELLAPIKLQLMRSVITVNHYKANDAYREKILKECNEAIRDLLLQKGFLIPSDLLPSAEKFINHYDEWLQVYEENRSIQNNTERAHIYTYNFPRDAEQAFVDKYEAYRNELKIENSIK
jgi:hypothetical protein